MNAMKSIGAVLVLVSILQLSWRTAAAGPAVGERAPDVVLPFLDGGEGHLAEWLGQKPVYLKIWATWCGTCRKEMPHFKAAYEAYGADIAFFSVNAGFNDTLQEVREFNEEYDLRMPSVVDRSGDIGQAFDLIATPYHVVIDESGRIVHLGHAADETVDRLLARLATPRHDDTAPQVSHAGTARSDTAKPAPKAGDLAPPFSIETLSGSMFSVDSDTGTSEPVYLLFFTAWCESYLAGEGDDRMTANACADTRKTINAAFEGADEPPKVIGIASRMWTGAAEIQEYRDAHDIRYPIALDQTNEIFSRYGVREFPTLITISDGRITARREGTINSLR